MRYIQQSFVIVLFLIIVIMPLTALAQYEHPIDKKQKACLALKENFTTAGMANCMNEAQVAWDEELNENYKSLMNFLKTPEQREALKQSQRAWIQHRDKEFEFINESYLTLMNGTMFIPIAAKEKKEFVKKRALELSVHLRGLKY